MLTHLLANVIGLVAGEFTHMIGDAHVYLSHVLPLTEQIKRTPSSFPRIVIRPDTKRTILDFKFEDLELVGYAPQNSIKMEMAV